jgi:hypothetical protein
MSANNACGPSVPAVNRGERTTGPLTVFAARARICKGLWSPEIDSDGSIPAAYVAWRAGTKNRVVVQARHAGNRFLGSLKGLQIRAQISHKAKYYEYSEPWNLFTFHI